MIINRNLWPPETGRPALISAFVGTFPKPSAGTSEAAEETK